MVALVEPFANFALSFSSPEFFAIVLFGLASVVALGRGLVVNSLISLCLGLLIATVGVDSIYGAERFAFGVAFLHDGIEFLLVMVGAYGIGEVLTRLNAGFARGPARPAGNSAIQTAFPRLSELLAMKGSFLRGTATGIAVGIVPGAGATVSAFVAYGIEGQFVHGKSGYKLGDGAPEGIVAAKSAATASVGGALVPLLTMGIPGSGATAIMLAAFLLHGIQPGPQVFVSSTSLIYTVFAAVFVGVVGMCILGYFAIKPLCKVLDAPEALVSAFVVVFCFIGAFAARSNLSDLYVIAVFGLVGFLFERFRFPIAPMVLGTILGPLTESAFMTTMVSFNNDWTVFFTRPISGTILVVAIIGLAFPFLRTIWERRRGQRQPRMADASMNDPVIATWLQRRAMSPRWSRVRATRKRSPTNTTRLVSTSWSRPPAGRSSSRHATVSSPSLPFPTPASEMSTIRSEKTIARLSVCCAT